MQVRPTDDLAGLRDVFSGRLLTDEADCAPFLTDWRRMWTGRALAVAQPGSTADVAAIVRWCHAHDVAIVPQGGNTGQSGGSVPRAMGRNLVLSLTRMTRIRAVDTANDTMTVDAGCILQTIQAAADAAGRLFPLSLGAEGSCTIGGNLATNAGGTAVLRYGNARDLCLGLEVVTADGAVWDGLKGLRKDNSGYDLRDLFIGSEGTLGVITGAVLKLFPRPAGRATAFVAVDSPDAALAVFAAMRRTHADALTAFEIMSHSALQRVVMHAPTAHLPLPPAPWSLLIEFSHAVSSAAVRSALESALRGVLADGYATDAVIAESIAQSRALWRLREMISEAQGATSRPVKHDIAVPVAATAAFMHDALAATATRVPDAQPIIFGHMGDGNLHFNFSLPKGINDTAFADAEHRLNDAVHAVVRKHHGTISAEHGLGALRRDDADAYRPPAERVLMQAIKLALDPKGIMNPGKVLPEK